MAAKKKASKKKEPELVKMMGWCKSDNYAQFVPGNSHFSATAEASPDWIPAFVMVDPNNYQSPSNAFMNATPVGVPPVAPSASPGMAGFVENHQPSPSQPVQAGNDAEPIQDRVTQPAVAAGLAVPGSPSPHDPFGVPEAQQPPRNTPLDMPPLAADVSG